jgi:hypothetical protein
MALFDTTTIQAGVETGPREDRTDVNKAFLSALTVDLAKGIFSTIGNTYPELFWDTTRRGFAWGQGENNAPDLYLQRQSSSVLELIDQANAVRQGFHIGTLDLDNYQDMAEISTPANPAANHARLYSKDDAGTTKLYFRDSAGAETEIGAGGGGGALDDLSDVAITSVADDEILGYSAGWINRTLAEAGIAALSHVHAAGDITSGSFAVNRGGTGRATLTSGSFMRGTDTAAVTMRTPAQVLADIGAAASSHGHALDDLSDVAITSVGAGEVLGYSSGWINRTLAEAGISATSHSHSDLLSSNSADEASGLITFSAAPQVTESAPSAPTLGRMYKDTVVRAWVRWDMTGTTILDDYNVSSITDNATGDATINIDTNIGNGNYVVAMLGRRKDTVATGESIRLCHVDHSVAPASGSVRVVMVNGVNQLRSSPQGHVVIYGS